MEEKIRLFLCTDSNNKIESSNKDGLYIIDGILTKIYSIRGNIAKGAVLNNDLTLTECYIAKYEDSFAHGKTLHDAMHDAMNKAFMKKSFNERIDEFISTHQLGVKYKAREFYEWHNKITGSCKFGRIKFVQEKGINLDTDELTVKEFIQFSENSFGNNIIQILKEKYKIQ